MNFARKLSQCRQVSGGMITMTRIHFCVSPFSRGVRIRLSRCNLRFANCEESTARRGADQPRVNSVTLMLTATSVPGGAIDYRVRIDLRSNEILRCRQSLLVGRCSARWSLLY